MDVPSYGVHFGKRNGLYGELLSGFFQLRKMYFLINFSEKDFL